METKLSTIRGQVQSLLPKVTVADHPYDIGYWAVFAGVAPQPDGQDNDFYAGWEQAMLEKTTAT